MSEQKRRFFEGNSATPTFIGADSVFIGNIRGSGHFVVSGEVHGDGDLQGGLNLSVTGSWHGFIQAQQAIVAGKITGGLSVKDKLEIGYTAVIRGRVSARTIAIAGHHRRRRNRSHLGRAPAGIRGKARRRVSEGAECHVSRRLRRIYGVEATRPFVARYARIESLFANGDRRTKSGVFPCIPASYRIFAKRLETNETIRCIVPPLTINSGIRALQLIHKLQARRQRRRNVRPRAQLHPDDG